MREAMLAGLAALIVAIGSGSPSLLTVKQARQAESFSVRSRQSGLVTLN